MRRSLSLLAAIAFASSAAAGVAYEFVSQTETPRYNEKSTGQVWVEGDSYRAEVTRADGSRVAVISTDADVSAKVVDFGKNVIADRQRVNGDIRSSAMFLFPGSRAAIVGKPKVNYRRGAATIIAAEAATEHVIQATFDAKTKDDIRATYQFTARIWTSNELPALPMKSRLRTGYAVVDAKVAEAEQNVTGMVLRHDLEVTRTIEGGIPTTERTSTVVTKLERVQVEPERFVPALE